MEISTYIQDVNHRQILLNGRENSSLKSKISGVETFLGFISFAGDPASQLCHAYVKVNWKCQYSVSVAQMSEADL